MNRYEIMASLKDSGSRWKRRKNNGNWSGELFEGSCHSRERNNASELFLVTNNYVDMLDRSREK